MSNHLAVAAVTATLRQIVFEVAQAAVGGVTITAGRPVANPTRGANVFLYQVAPNAAFRNEDMSTRSIAGRLERRPRAALDLFYLISFHGEEAQYIPQRILGAVVARLHARPLLSPALIEAVIADPALPFLAAADLAEQVERVRLTPHALSIEDLSKMWATFPQVPLALSVAYHVSVVLIDTEEPVAPGPPVLTRTVTAMASGRPRVDRVLASGDPDGTITAGARIDIEGTGLRGDATEVLIGGRAANVVSAHERRLTVDLPANLDIGPHPLVVAHPILLGVPPVPHRGVESRTVPLVLHPRVARDGGGAPQLATVAIGGRHRVTVTVEPPVRRGQSAQLELLDADGLVRHRVSAQPFAAAFEADLRFEVDAPAGQYRARVRVDWAESPLWIDGRAGPTQGQLIPLVVIP